MTSIIIIIIIFRVASLKAAPLADCSRYHFLAVVVIVLLIFSAKNNGDHRDNYGRGERVVGQLSFFHEK